MPPAELPYTPACHNVAAPVDLKREHDQVRSETIRNTTLRFHEEAPQT